MTKLFSISDLQTFKTVDESDKNDSAMLAESFLEVHNFKLESLKKLVPSLPNSNQIFFIWTINSFNAFTFIPHIIKNAGQIDELIIATYSINSRIVHAFTKLIDSGKIKQVTVFISSTMKFRMPAVVDLLASLTDHRPELKVIYAWSHAKVAMARVGESHYIVEGSGNWGENAKHEQYIFLESKSVFEFRKNWLINEFDS
jgi:hypothetical protein